MLSIGQLAERTGVSVETLRAWERRYGVLRPVRSRGGHRRYSAADVERVMWLINRLTSGSGSPRRPARCAWSTSSGALASTTGS